MYFALAFKDTRYVYSLPRGHLLPNYSSLTARIQVDEIIIIKSYMQKACDGWRFRD